MNEQYPLTVFFDASCSLCRNEIETIKIHDAKQLLQLVDCSDARFDDSPYRIEGITREDMMNLMHVRSNRGEWIIGVSAFELLYRTVGMPALANFWGGRYTRPLTERVYPWIARHRQIISCTGLPMLFKLWGTCKARRALNRSQQCSKGQCSI